MRKLLLPLVFLVALIGFASGSVVFASDCWVEDFTMNPDSSPQPISTTIYLYGRGQCSGGIRASRFTIDGNGFGEDAGLGEQSESWKLTAGTHEICFEISGGVNGDWPYGARSCKTITSEPSQNWFINGQVCNSSSINIWVTAQDVTQERFVKLLLPPKSCTNRFIYDAEGIWGKKCKPDGTCNYQLWKVGWYRARVRNSLTDAEGIRLKIISGARNSGWVNKMPCGWQEQNAVPAKEDINYRIAAPPRSAPPEGPCKK